MYISEEDVSIGKKEENSTEYSLPLQEELSGFLNHPTLLKLIISFLLPRIQEPLTPSFLVLCLRYIRKRLHGMALGGKIIKKS